MIYRIYKTPIYRALESESVDANESTLDEEIKRLKLKVKLISDEHRKIEEVYARKEDITNTLIRLNQESPKIDNELKEIDDKIKTNKESRESDANSIDDSPDNFKIERFKEKYKDFFEKITDDDLIQSQHSCAQFVVFFENYSDIVAQYIHSANNFISKNNIEDSEFDEAKKTLKDLLNLYQDNFLGDDNDKKFNLIIKGLNPSNFNEIANLLKKHYNYDDPLDGSIEKNSFNSIIKALDSYSNEYLIAYSDQFQDALLKKEVLDGLRFLSQKLQKTFDDFQPTTNNNQIISDNLLKIETESKKTKIVQEIAKINQELKDLEPEINEYKGIREKTKNDLNQDLGDYNSKKRLKAQENLFDDATKNIVINSNESLEEYLSHLKIQEDANAKKITFNKIKVDPSSAHELKFGNAKLVDFGYFDVNNSKKNQRVFYGNQDIIANDSIDEYRNQLARKLALYNSLKNKIKASSTLELPEIDYSTDTKIGDIDKKICELLIIANNDLFPTDPSFAIDKYFLDLAQDYSNLNLQELKDLNKKFFKLHDQDSWTNDEFKVSFGNLELSLPRKADEFFDHAKIMMQNEALKHDQDADFVKNAFVKDEYLDDYRFYKTLNTESVKQQKFRVKFSRNSDSSNHAQVSVDISGKYDSSLDVINICLDKDRDIFRQILLKNDGSRMPIIESTSYVIKKNGKMHKIDLDKKSYSIQEGKLTDIDKIDIDKVIKREEISLNLNGKKYIFRGRDGVEIAGKNRTSSLTSSVTNPDKFENFLESKSKNAKLHHQLDSDNNHGIFIKNSQEAEIIVATPKTMLKSSKNITVKIIEDHKIGSLERDGINFEIHAIKLANENKYKLFLKKSDETFEEYQNFKKTHKVEFGKDKIQLNSKLLSAKEAEKTPSPSRFPMSKFPTNLGFGPNLQNEENFNFKVQSQKAIKSVKLSFKNDGSYSFIESQEREFIPSPTISPNSTRGNRATSVAI